MHRRHNEYRAHRAHVEITAGMAKRNGPRARPSAHHAGGSWWLGVRRSGSQCGREAPSRAGPAAPHRCCKHGSELVGDQAELALSRCRCGCTRGWALDPGGVKRTIIRHRFRAGCPRALQAAQVEPSCRPPAVHPMLHRISSLSLDCVIAMQQRSDGCHSRHAGISSSPLETASSPSPSRPLEH